MRRWQLLIALVAALVAGAGAGSYKGASYGGGSFRTAGASYQGGGVAADYEPVVVLLSTQTRVAVPVYIEGVQGITTNPAGVDTFALPASPSAADQARIYEMNDYVLGRDRKSFRPDFSDTARVYRLGAAAGAGADFPSFAYAEVDSLRPLGLNAKDVSGTQVGVFSAPRISPFSVVALSMSAVTVTAADSATFGRPHFEMVYIPSNVIPTDVTVVSATINVSCAGNYYWTSNDTLVATLMTNPNDNDWYLQKGITNHPDFAETSWRRQNTSVFGGGSVNVNPWVPELNLRTKAWDYGEICDWTGSTRTGGDFIPIGTNVQIQATNCFQAAALTGAVNNGIRLSYHENNVASYAFKHYNWDRLSNSTVNNRTPYVAIKYIEKRYRPPFGTHEWAFCFSTDDGKAAANASYDSVFALHGGKYTLFITNAVLNTATYLTSAGVMGLYDSGNEVGLHSAKHVTTVGLKRYHHTSLNGGGNLAVGAATTGWDSLMLDSSAEWLYQIAEGLGYTGVRDDLRFGKSFAFPNGPWSPEILEALYRNGYTAIRGTGLGAAYDRVMYFEKAPIGAARCDTAVIDGPTTQGGRFARNMSLMSVTLGSSNETTHSLWGAKTDPAGDAAELEEVRNNFRRIIYQLIGQNRRTLITFTHALKTNPAPPSGYADGVNADELEAALDVVDVFAGGGRYMGYAENKDWVKARATGIATPAFATAPDTFQVEASEKIWCRPDGIDGRWIPGVK